MKTHDNIDRIKKGGDTEYCCQYCSKIFFVRMQHIENIANEHKKCGICNNTFPSEKVLETHTKAVHKKFNLGPHLSENQDLRIIKTRSTSRKNFQKNDELLVFFKYSKKT